MAKIYTKGGDKGNTTLYGGSVIGKDSLRVKTYGAVDNANVALGIARAHLDNHLLNQLVEVCQLKLFELAAEVASDSEARLKLKNKIGESDIVFLEKAIDELSRELEDKSYFMVPGKSILSANFHGARVSVRSAERELVTLSAVEEVSQELIKYLNRLSDLMFILGRYVDEVNIGLAPLDLDLKAAENIKNRCLKKAKELDIKISIAVVDHSGELISFAKMPGSLLISGKMAMDKAYTSVALRMSTEELKDIASPNGSIYGIENFPRMVIFGGGTPIISGNKVVGALGISGGTVEQDIFIAKFGVQSFNE